MTKMLTAAVEDYLRAIHDLYAVEGERVSTSALAERLEVSSASVTGMLKKLSQSEPKLIDYQRYRGVTLTQAGETIALEVIRHHRLIEAYLIQALGYSWDEVHEEADQLEHVISEALEARIAEYLGHPETDPHGDPIPSLEGRLELQEAMPLTLLQPGEVCRVVRVTDDAELLRYLADLGVGLGSELRVTEKGPFEGPVHVRVDESRGSRALSEKVSDQLFVVKHRTEKVEDDR
jgi:DtxR family Mn-dependent transcriptional regulator